MRIVFVLFVLAIQSGCVTIGVSYPIGRNISLSARTNLKTLDLTVKGR